jgi:glycosyltransferase involved in cell wall biosynthesis
MSRTPKILILTNAPLCRNPRVVKEAQTLGDAGFQVTVLGVRSHAQSVPLDREIVRNSRFDHVQIEQLHGIRAWLRRARTRLAREGVRRFGWQLPSALGPTAALLAVSRRIQADLVIAHTEAPLWVACCLLREGYRVAADFEDWHSEDLLPGDRLSRPLRLLISVEDFLINHAAYVTTTSQALSLALHARYGGRGAVVIRNAFPLQSDPFSASSAAPIDPDIPTLCWFSQTIGTGRGLEEFVAVWSRLQIRTKLILLGASAPSFRNELREMVVPDRQNDLVFHDVVPPDALPAWLAQNQVGLALELATPVNRDLTITNKIIQYCNAGLALVATRTTGQLEVLNAFPNAGIGIDLSKTSETVAQLNEFLGSAATLHQARKAARRAAVDQYCWEKESPRLLEIVRQALTSEQK